MFPAGVVAHQRLGLASETPRCRNGVRVVVDSVLAPTFNQSVITKYGIKDTFTSVRCPCE